MTLLSAAVGVVQLTAEEETTGPRPLGWSPSLRFVHVIPAKMSIL